MEVRPTGHYRAAKGSRGAPAGADTGPLASGSPPDDHPKEVGDNMPDQKYMDAAEKFLGSKISALAEWLERHEKAIRVTEGDDVRVFVQRSDTIDSQDLDWHYCNLQFELSYGNEVL